MLYYGDGAHGRGDRRRRAARVAFAPLVADLKLLDRRRIDLVAQLDGLERARAMRASDVARLEATMLARHDDWRGLLRRYPRAPRQLLSGLLDGRIVLTPTVEAYDFPHTRHARQNRGRRLGVCGTPHRASRRALTTLSWLRSLAPGSSALGC